MPLNHRFTNRLQTTNSSPNPEKPEESEKGQPAVNSYGQILRSSSIIGGATGINQVIGLIRTKTVAVLPGLTGVGFVGMYISLTGLNSTIAQMGLDKSGVSELAEANGSGTPDRVTMSLTF